MDVLQRLDAQLSKHRPLRLLIVCDAISTGSKHTKQKYSYEALGTWLCAPWKAYLSLKASASSISTSLSPHVSVGMFCRKVISACARNQRCETGKQDETKSGMPGSPCSPGCASRMWSGRQHTRMCGTQQSHQPRSDRRPTERESTKKTFRIQTQKTTKYGLTNRMMQLRGISRINRQFIHRRANWRYSIPLDVMCW